MYKVVIVDDELTILNQLIDIVEWHSLGFDLVGKFSNSTNTLDYLRKAPVDILFTDIRLGSEFGIQLAKEARLIQNNIEIVFISAYSDFSYAREAVLIGAFDYLLKPVSLDDIESCFFRLKEKLDTERDVLLTMEDYKRISRRQLLSDLFNGVIQNPDEFRLREQRLGLTSILNGRVFAFCHLRTSAEPDELEADISRAIQLENNGITYDILKIAKHSLCILFSIPRDLYQKDETSKLLTVIRNNVLTTYDTDPDICCMAVSSNLFALIQQYQKLTTVVPNTEAILKRIKSHLISGEADAAYKLFEMMIELYRLDRNGILEMVDQLLTLISSDKFMNVTTIRNLHADLRQCRNLSELQSHIAYSMYKLTALLSESSQQDYQMVRACAYIETNYNGSISLESIAEYVSLSPAYFSRCFKKYTGSKFVDYVQNLRIKHALEYLSDPNTKVSDLHRLVGYNSRSQFYNVFVQIMGCTPTIWQKNTTGLLAEDDVT